MDNSSYQCQNAHALAMDNISQRNGLPECQDGPAKPNRPYIATPFTPFLKWAGGKRWFVHRYAPLLPTGYARYIEPFCGSAAVFFHLQPKKALLSDLNEELISIYRAVKNNPMTIISHLQEHQYQHSKSHYYQVRASLPNDPTARASALIYLNRVCWNGLYRVNRKGVFNVPIGTKSRVLLPSDNFYRASELLRNTELLSVDFETIIDTAGPGDFVFADPPYTSNHNHNGFIKYNQKLFSWDDQIRLMEACTRAASRGALLAITNANHQSIRNLYDKFALFLELSRASTISGHNSGRQVTTELLICLWK